MGRASCRCARERKKLNLEAYSSFSQVYDLFMDNIPYEELCNYIKGLLTEYGIEDGLLLDLGCGTGKLTRLLAASGYDMIGVDNSEEMLEIAREHEEEGRENEILYLLQDMREFELYGTVRGVVSICDSINYILEEADLRRVFELVNNYLDPKGIFIFDLNTVYKYRELLGENTISESREESSFIWENWYDPDDQVNEYDLTLFIRNDEGLYEKYEETHYQRAYALETVCQLIRQAGMKLEAVYDAFTFEKPRPDSERVYIVAREQGK